MHTRVTILVQKIYTNISGQSIYRVNCYLRQRGSWLLMFVCISRLVTPAYTHLVRSVQVHCSRSGKAERVVDYGTIISYFMMPLSAFDCFGRKPLSPLILLMLSISSWTQFKVELQFSGLPITKIIHDVALMAQGFPELDN